MTSTIPGEGPLHAVLQTSSGLIVLRLYEELVPKTVANFVGLATGTKTWRHPVTGEKQVGRPLYDGTTFHRVMPNFMIQGGDPFSSVIDGDPEQAGRGDGGFHFDDELRRELRFDRPGLVAMANQGPGTKTNSTQFFIAETALPNLDGAHTIFGEVVEGFERVPKIARVRTGEGARPLKPVVIEHIEIGRGKFWT